MDKAGADSLFRDPSKKSTNVGVTVYPVRIASLDQFGDLQAVGERLLGAGEGEAAGAHGQRLWPFPRKSLVGRCGQAGGSGCQARRRHARSWGVLLLHSPAACTAPPLQLQPRQAA